MGFLLLRSIRSLDSVVKDRLFPRDLPAPVPALPFFPLTETGLEYALSEVVVGRGQTDRTACKDLLSQKGVLHLV